MPKEVQTLGMRDARLSTPLLQRNLLLAAMSANERLRMLPHADLVQLKAGQRLDEPVRGRRRAYFPLTSIAHLCRDTPDGTSVQVALVGSEGVVGLSFLAGDEARGIRSLAMMPGAALAIDEQRLAQEFRRGGHAMPCCATRSGSWDRWHRSPYATATTRSSSSFHAGSS